MLDNLYANIGGKIKGLAKWTFIVEAIGAIITGIVMINADSTLVLYGMLTIFFGPIVAFVSTWILYAFGELVDKTCALAEKNGITDIYALGEPVDNTDIIARNSNILVQQGIENPTVLKNTSSNTQVSAESENSTITSIETEETLVESGVKYTLHKNGTYSVSVGTPPVTNELIIPSEFKGRYVTEIEAYAFKDCTQIKSVTLGNGVKNIGILAFYSCTNLTSISLPDSITKIDNQAFANCTELSSITLPSQITQIGIGTFRSCTGLTNIKFSGTTKQWKLVKKGDSWHNDVPATVVVCSDGEVNIK